MASKLIDHNPMLKKPVLKLMGLCLERSGSSRELIEEEAADIWTPSFTRPPSSVLDAMIRAGYVREQIVVDGQPYDGSLEDVYRDEAVADDAEVDSILISTPEGERLLVDYSPEVMLAALLKAKPRYASVFQKALEACAAESGLTRAQFESVIDAEVGRQGLSAADGGVVYPQYFIDALETAGGIEWDGSWRATDAGRKASIS